MKLLLRLTDISLGLFDNNSTIHIASPSDVLGAGSTPDDLRYRFPSADIREPIAKDMANEDKILQHYINKCRLEHWYQTADSWAKERLQKEAEAKIEHGEQRKKVVAQLENENEDLKHKGPVTAPVYDEPAHASALTNGEGS